MSSRSESAAAGPLTQRLVCALMEENLMPSKDSIDDKDTKGNYSVVEIKVTTRDKSDKFSF